MLNLTPYKPNQPEKTGFNPTPYGGFPAEEPQQNKKSFFDKLASFGQAGQNLAVGIASSVAQPFTKVVGSGVRSAQAIPSLLRGDVAKSNEIQAKPIFGQPTLAGSTALQNLGTAAQIGSFAIGGEGASAVGAGAVKAAAKTGALTGALQSLGTYVADEKNPTIGKALVNTGVGAGLGAATGAGLGYLSQRLQNTPARQLDDTWKSIQPQLNNKEQTAAIKAGKLEVQKGTVTLKPTGQDLKMRDLAHSLGVSTKNDPVANVKLLQQGIADSATQVRSDLQGTKAIWNSNELTGKLRANVLNPIEQGKPGFITVKSDETLNRTAKNLVSAIDDMAVNANRHATGLLDIRQNFDDIVEQEFGTSIFAKTDPRGNVVRAIRQTLNQMLEDKAPSSAIKAELKNQSLLYRAIDNISLKAPKSEAVGGLGYKVGSTKLQRALKHPVTKAVEAIGVGGALFEGAKGVAKVFKK